MDALRSQRLIFLDRRGVDVDQLSGERSGCAGLAGEHGGGKVTNQRRDGTGDDIQDAWGERRPHAHCAECVAEPRREVGGVGGVGRDGAGVGAGEWPAGEEAGGP